MAFVGAAPGANHSISGAASKLPSKAKGRLMRLANRAFHNLIRSASSETSAVKF